MLVFSYVFWRIYRNKQCKPEELIFYKRYIDDEFGLWTGTQDSLLHYLKSYAPRLQQHIRITTCISTTGVDFLDIRLFKGEDFLHLNKLSSNCSQKELNRYQYLPHSSWHPQHQKKAFIIGELQRYILREDVITLQQKRDG